jgi:hypothetical protein
LGVIVGAPGFRLGGQGRIQRSENKVINGTAFLLIAVLK